MFFETMACVLRSVKEKYYYQIDRYFPSSEIYLSNKFFILSLIDKY